MCATGRHSKAIEHRSGMWIAILAAAIVLGLVTGFIAFDPLGLRAKNGAPGATGDAAGPTQESSSAPPAESGTASATPDAAGSAWVIGYVTDVGLATMREDGTVSVTPSLVGKTADWAPDRAHVAMLAYSRADLAYVSDVAIVAYPSGTTVLPFHGDRGQIEYFGWTTDSKSIIWTGVDGGFRRADASTGVEGAVSDPPEEPSLPPLPSGPAEDAIVTVVTGSLDPPADAGTEVFVMAGWPSTDGRLLLVGVEVWRNADKEAALMKRETSVWLANADGTGARRLAAGHSPAWLSE